MAIAAIVLIGGDRLLWENAPRSLTAVFPTGVPPVSAQSSPTEAPPDLPSDLDTPVTSPPFPEPTTFPGADTPDADNPDADNPDAVPTPVPEPTGSPAPTADRPAADLAPLPLPERADDLPAVTPLPVTNTYIDANARFRVGIVQGYRVSPLAGSVLIEAPDGVLAYTVVVQPVQREVFDQQPLDNFALAQVARTAFARGEGFSSSAIPVDLPTGGVQVNWSGSLTIAGQTQPVQGVILARQTGSDVLLLLIAAAQGGIEQIPNAVAALVDTFQPLL